MLAPAGATDTWGGRPAMSVVRTTPIGVPTRSRTLHASMSLEVPPTLWGPARAPAPGFLRPRATGRFPYPGGRRAVRHGGLGVSSPRGRLPAAGACLFSYLLKAEPDGYSDGLCRTCAPHAPDPSHPLSSPGQSATPCLEKH